jgi:hypothetical protein
MPPLSFTLPLAATEVIKHRISSALVEGFSQWWQMPLLVTGLLAIAAWMAWMVRKDAAELPRGLGPLLALLRLGALAALAAAYLDLQRTAEHEVVFPSRVAVVVDSSASMTLPDNLDAPAPPPSLPDARPEAGSAGVAASQSRSERAVDLLERDGLLAALAGRHEVSVWRFDADAESLVVLPTAASAAAAAVTRTEPPAGISPPDAWRSQLQPRGFETRIGEAIVRVIDQEPAGTLAGVVLLTDGGNNAGIDPVAAAGALAKAGVPLFAFGTGSDRLPTNVRLADLIVPARVYPGDRFAVQAYLQAQGLAGQAVKVELAERATAEGAGGDAVREARVLDATDVVLAPDGELAGVRFEVPGLDVPGRHEIVLRVAVPAADRTPADNVQTAEVEVVDRVTQVLLMASGPTREYQFMRNVLERDKSFAVDVLLGTATRGASQDARRILEGFPATVEELSAYDCIVAFDVDWRTLDPAAQARLDRWVSRESGGLILVAGNVFMDAWLADPQSTVVRGLHPIELRRSGQSLVDEPAGFEAPMPLQFTRDGLEAEFLWLGSSRIASQTVWSEFEGVYSCFDATAPKPGATVYARVLPPGMPDPLATAGTAGRGAISMAGQFYGSGSVFYMGSGETWRLRALDDALFERLTTQLVRHVSQGRLLAGSRRARLLVERDRYPVGATIVVRVVAADGEGAAVLASATCRAEGPDGGPVRVPLAADPGRPGVFQGGFVAAREGGWKIDVDLGDGSGEVLTRRIQARLPDRELERPRLDRGLLDRLGAITGGASCFLADGPWGPERSAALAERIADRSRREYETGAPDGDFKRRLNAFLLAAGIGLLCLEWIIRRFVKLA